MSVTLSNYYVQKIISLSHILMDLYTVESTSHPSFPPIWTNCLIVDTTIDQILVLRWVEAQLPTASK